MPVYWMATEDHDFEEINYFNFQEKKVQWNLESTEELLDDFQQKVCPMYLKNSHPI